VYLWDISIQWSVIHESAMSSSYLVILEIKGKGKKAKNKFFFENIAEIKVKMKKK